MSSLTKKMTALMLAGVMLSSLAACSGAGNQTTSGNTGAGNNNGNRNGKSVLISMLSVTPEEQEYREQFIEKPMREAFPDLDIKFEVYTDRQSLQVQVTGGGGPDIMDLDGPTDAAEFAKAERVVALDTYAKQYGWEDIFYDWAWGTSYFDGSLYSLPNSFEGMMLYFNTDVFEAQGWDYPTNANEMTDVMKKAQEAGIIPISFGNAAYQGAVDWLYSTFLSCYAGPDTLKAGLEGTVTFKDDPLLMGSMSLMVDWWQEGWIGDKASQAINEDDMLSLFSTGKAAMMINGTWCAGQLVTTYPECNWDTELMPELRDGVGRILPMATGGCYVINANSKVQDESAELLNWLFTSVDRHMDSVVEASMQPYPIQAFDLNDLNGMDVRMVDMYESLVDAQEKGDVGFCSWTFFPSDARVYMNENTDALFLGSLDVKEYMAETQTFIDNALANGTAPALP